MKGFSVTVVAVLSLVLASCANHSLEDLRQATPEGTPYQNALARFYLDFAESEEKANQSSNAAYFADKGLMSAYGKDVSPEVPDQWNVSGEVLGSMEKAHADLLEALTPSVMDVQPQLAADALFYFDCWVVLSERDAAGEETLRCRDKMAAALIKLHAPAAKKAIPTLKPKAAKPVEDVVAAEEDAVEDVPAKKPVMVAPMVNHKEPFSPVGREDTSKAVKMASDSADYIIFFGFDQWILTDAGEAVISEVVKSLAREESYEIVLSGHTDRSGDAKYNLMLSKRRADVVKNRLIEQGIMPERIKMFAFGESDPRIPTEDGVREAGNRRVEIALQ